MVCISAPEFLFPEFFDDSFYFLISRTLQLSSLIVYFSSLSSGFLLQLSLVLLIFPYYPNNSSGISGVQRVRLFQGLPSSCGCHVWGPVSSPVTGTQNVRWVKGTPAFTIESLLVGLFVFPPYMQWPLSISLKNIYILKVLYRCRYEKWWECGRGINFMIMLNKLIPETFPLSLKIFKFWNVTHFLLVFINLFSKVLKPKEGRDEESVFKCQ